MSSSWRYTDSFASWSISVQTAASVVPGMYVMKMMWKSPKATRPWGLGSGSGMSGARRSRCYMAEYPV